jgi:hypothetical protein
MGREAHKEKCCFALTVTLGLLALSTLATPATAETRAINRETARDMRAAPIAAPQMTDPSVDTRAPRENASKVQRGDGDAKTADLRGDRRRDGAAERPRTKRRR